MGCTVGFRAILDQSFAFTTLDKKWTASAFHLGARSWNAMRESKIILEFFYQLFIDLFWYILLFLGLSTSLFEDTLKPSLRILKWFNIV